MNLLYKSTRNAEKTVTASEAILKVLQMTENFLFRDDSKAGCRYGDTERDVLSRDSICGDETVFYRFYGRRIKKLYHKSI